MNRDLAKTALTRLAELLGKSPVVVSATLFGSYVRGDYRPETSDIDLALVVRGDDVSSIAPALRDAWWAARVDPWIAREDELAGLADAFATRVRDIQRRHEMLIGTDPWGALDVPRAALRLRVEQELRNHQLRLRRAQVLGDPAGLSRQLHAIAGALRLDLALALELAGTACTDSVDGIAGGAATRLDLVQADVHAVLAYRAQPGGELAPLLAHAARLLDRAVAFVDRLEVS